ncbi:MAG: hypothetical protein EOO75_14810 [Myxococcales bacterium]|nr:MAG: hypothetical protein EOO75_14810 [Myxococcales bacterium]
MVPSSRLLTAPAPGPVVRPGHLPDALGALLGVATLWAISLAHPTDHQIASELGVGSTFALLALKLAPPLLLSYALVAVAHALWPRDAVGWLQRGGPLGQSLRALVIGPLAPVCSCGVLPLYEALRERAVSAPASLTLLLVTPGLSLVALVPSLGLLGAPLTAARLLGALLAAVAVGLASARLAARPDVPAARASGGQTAPGTTSLSERLRDGLRYAVTDVVDHTAPWLLLGLGLGAFLEPSLSPTALAGLGALAVPLCALAGIPLYLCAAGLTPLLAVLLHKGLPPGAALAVLLTGPTLNVSVLRLLGHLHGPRVAWIVGVLTLTVALALGLGADALITPVDRLVLHDDAAAAPGALQLGSLAVLVALSLGSLLRRGPRFWAEQIVAEHPEH